MEGCIESVSAVSGERLAVGNIPSHRFWHQAWDLHLSLNTRTRYPMAETRDL